MKRKYIQLIVIFVLLSIFLCAMTVFLSVKSDMADSLRNRRELSRLSSMMRVLAQALEREENESCKLSAAMIESSGTLSSLGNENKEQVLRYIHMIISDEITDYTKAAAYARRCTLAAKKIAGGDEYQIGEYDINETATEARHTDFEIKNALRRSRAAYKGNIRFVGQTSGDNIISARGNVYFMTQIDDITTFEYAYLKKDTGGTPLSDEEAVDISASFFEARGIKCDKYSILLRDTSNIFVYCYDADNDYILGMTCNGGNISHYKKTNKSVAVNINQ